MAIYNAVITDWYQKLNAGHTPLMEISVSSFLIILSVIWNSSDNWKTFKIETAVSSAYLNTLPRNSRRDLAQWLYVIRD